MIDCSTIMEVLQEVGGCEQTPNGLRVRTHCLYPSFERVSAFVRSSGDGFEVTDGGEAMSIAWLHGRDHAHAARRLKQAALHYGCEFTNDALFLRAPSIEWLSQALVAVANAAAEGANSSVESVGASSELSLVSKIRSTLEASPIGFSARLEHATVGKSGKLHRHDLLVDYNQEQILIDVVVPHHNSVAAKYLALSDTLDAKGLWKYAVFDRELDRADKALLANVADVIPFKAIAETSGRALLTH